MRIKGAKTNKECWECNVSVRGDSLLNKRFKTLTDVANELNMSYHQVVEIANNRRKERNGKYEPLYKIIKLSTIDDKEPDPNVEQGVLFSDEKEGSV